MTRNEGNHVLLLVVIMAVSVLVVLSVSMRLLYLTSIEQQSLRLVETVQSQVAFIQAVAQFDEGMSEAKSEAKLEALILDQVLNAFTRASDSNRTFELVLAKRAGDQIRFLVSRKGAESAAEHLIPIASKLAEPMQRALAGESGSMIGRDYDGTRVLAAYTPIERFGYGVVAKLDHSEISDPFWSAIGISLLVAFAFIALGSWQFNRIGARILHQLSESESRSRAVAEKLKRLNERLEHEVDLRTDRLKAQHADLEESLAWTEALMDAAADGIIVVNEVGRIESFNKAAESIFSYKASEMVGADFALLIPDSNREYQELFKGKSKIIGKVREIVAMRRGRILFPAEIKIRNVERGEACRYIVSIQDLSERNRAKRALVEAKEHSRLLLESVAEGVLGLDTSFHVTFANSSAATMLGYRNSELIGREIGDLITAHHEDGSLNLDVRRSTDATYANGEVITAEEKLLRSNGELLPVRYTSTPMRKHGAVVGAVLSFIDLTSEIESNMALEKEHRFNERLVHSIPSILIAVDINLTITLWNRAAESVFHIAADKAIGRDAKACGIHCDWVMLGRSVVRSRYHGMDRLDNFKFSLADGTEGYLGLTFNPIIEHEQITGFLLLGSDITERIRLQNQLQLAQKLEAVGELAAGIAHEINTPLQYVGDNVRFLQSAFSDIQELMARYEQLKQQCKSDPKAEALIGEIEQVAADADIGFVMEELPQALDQSLDGIARAARIVGAMKEFSHPGQREKSLTDINRMLESTITVARNEWKYVAEVHTDFDDQLPLVKCLPELNQVFLNLLVNAAHAIEDSLGEKSDEKGLISVSTALEGDQQILIQFSDNGAGIPQIIQQKVFDPFFTTKEVGKGTGQGLAISHSIVVEQHGGSLDFESEEGKGTRFMIRIPVDQGGSE